MDDYEFLSRINWGDEVLVSHRLMIRWLRHEKGFHLNSWERKFLKDIKNKTKHSFLQREKLLEIYNQYRRW